MLANDVQQPVTDRDELEDFQTAFQEFLKREQLKEQSRRPAYTHDEYEEFKKDLEDFLQKKRFEELLKTYEVQNSSSLVTSTSRGSCGSFGDADGVEIELPKEAGAVQPCPIEDLPAGFTLEIELPKEANCNEPSCGSSDGTNEVEIELDRESSSSQSSCSSFVGDAEPKELSLIHI